MVGWWRKRRSCCQRVCCAIRRVVERWERERGYGDGSGGIWCWDCVVLVWRRGLGMLRG